MTQRTSREPSADSERPRSELDFERGDGRKGPIGDPKPEREVREEFPGRRERDGGATGEEGPDARDTDDEMTPENLLDPDSPTADDTSMSVVAGDGIGAGSGPDEAELAERDPVGARQAARTQRKSRAHAADPNMVEPHEAQERADAARMRKRNGDA